MFLGFDGDPSLLESWQALQDYMFPLHGTGLRMIFNKSLSTKQLIMEEELHSKGSSIARDSKWSIKVNYYHFYYMSSTLSNACISGNTTAL